MSTPSRLRSAPSVGRVYTADAGAERIHEIKVSDDTVGASFF